MLEIINEKIIDTCILSNGYIVRDGFVFTSITEPANVYDAIVIRYPESADINSPKLPKSAHSFYEHLELIKTHDLDCALLICDSLEFLDKCPSLRKLKIIPSDFATDDFDFSPLYFCKEIISFSCRTCYGASQNFHSLIDYSKVRGLKHLKLVGDDFINLENIDTLESLWLSDSKSISDLRKINTNHNLSELVIMHSSLTTLRGIGELTNIQSLSLWRNGKLRDISDLYLAKNSLVELSIENCSKLEDFGVLSELNMLQNLELYGNNDLPDLGFLGVMERLRTFSFSMNVLDGDLRNCLKVPFAYCAKNRKHYNLKDKDLPKNY